jgi:glutamine synthetase
MRAVEQLELRQVNLRYVGGDGRLKTVAFPINSREHLIEVLTQGERVDGSSIFPGHRDPTPVTLHRAALSHGLL